MTHRLATVFAFATDAATFWDQIYQETTSSSLTLDEKVELALTSAQSFFHCDETSRILDIGCGRGETSVFWARTGAQVTAVDYSPAAIAELTEYCTRRGITNIRPIAGNAMTIDDLGQFDYVFGSLILHHLEPFRAFATVLRRSLKADGKAFFYENNGASDFLMWVRDHVIGKLWIPKWGDKDESPLAPHEIELLRALFNVSVIYPEMKFFQLAATYIFRGRFGRQLKMIDDFLFRHEIGLAYSYRQYIMLESRPR
jgi:2-polyprenyl-3-methyl-5-hydroxy-6-metoxy-1,4-benzoquinol methylase